jgi:uncharacterized protein YgbK (DUF1537 family)
MKRELDIQQLLSRYSSNEVLASEVAAARRARVDHLIVLDDDPTGTQTVYDVPVRTQWRRADIEEEFRLRTPVFFILTNSRSLPEPEAVLLAREIGGHIRDLSRQYQRRCWVVSRSDSTLRGHFPAEVDVLQHALGLPEATQFLIPAFFEGGRYTADNIHYFLENETLIPVAESPYARDEVFAYRHSDLRDWVEEKTKGRIRASEVACVSLETLRTGEPEELHAFLDTLSARVCVVNALDYHDLRRFTLALCASRVQALFRTAASFVAAAAGMAPRAPLGAASLLYRQERGGLLVVGSHVPKSSAQLERLLRAHPDIQPLELEVSKILSGQNLALLQQDYLARTRRHIAAGRDVALFTSRERRKGQSPADSFSISQSVSHFITQLVGDLDIAPAFFIAKGGITSSDIATIGLGARRAMVLGQILSGVPVWELGEESLFPGLRYVIFPGNVGDDEALARLFFEIKKVRKL